MTPRYQPPSKLIQLQYSYHVQMDKHSQANMHKLCCETSLVCYLTTLHQFQVYLTSKEIDVRTVIKDELEGHWIGDDLLYKCGQTGKVVLNF